MLRQTHARFTAGAPPTFDQILEEIGVWVDRSKRQCDGRESWLRGADLNR